MEAAFKLRFPPANQHFAQRELDFDTPHGIRAQPAVLALDA
jgi:hypothetical protein